MIIIITKFSQFYTLLTHAYIFRVISHLQSRMKQHFNKICVYVHAGGKMCGDQETTLGVSPCLPAQEKVSSAAQAWLAGLLI